MDSADAAAGEAPNAAAASEKSKPSAKGILTELYSGGTTDDVKEAVSCLRCGLRGMLMRVPAYNVSRLLAKSLKLCVSSKLHLQGAGWRRHPSYRGLTAVYHFRDEGRIVHPPGRAAQVRMVSLHSTSVIVL